MILRSIFGGLLTIVLISTSMAQSGSGALLQWRDVSGAYSVEARFVSFDGENVKLEKESGVVVSIPISKLDTESANRVRATEMAETVEVAVMEKADLIVDRSEFLRGLTPGSAQDHLDQMITPGKTIAWPAVAWYYKRQEGLYLLGADRFLTKWVPAAFKPDFLFVAVSVVSALVGIICTLWWITKLFGESLWWGLSYILPFLIILGAQQWRTGQPQGIVLLALSIGVGLVSIYFLIANLVFLFKHWSDVWKMFFFWIFNSLVGAASLFLIPDWAIEHAVVENIVHHESDNS